MKTDREALKPVLDDFEKDLDYSYKDRENLLLALTHSSYANENKSERLQSNERLEFLGDAVLNIVISEYIFASNASFNEGELTKIRASIVCEASLLKCSEEAKVGKYLLLGKGEELTGGRTRISILSDAFEALIGSIYLDGGLNSARKFILKKMKSIIEEASEGTSFVDYKTQLQEIVQKNSGNTVLYEIVDEKGPDHNKVFVSQVLVSDRFLGIGEGKSKKEAEQNAAKAALEKLVE
jgi:ribonuclease-3